MYRHKRNNYKKNPKIIIISFSVLILFMAVGYAAFSTDIDLHIKGNVKEKPYLKDAVLDAEGGASTIEAKTTPNFDTIATTDEGMFAAQDDLGTSYYYRGAVTDNYVKFANRYWRIIRINGDGSIRMIYDGSSAHDNGEASTDRYVTTSVFNTNYNDAKYVGYMYGGTSQDAASTSYEEATTNTYDSTIKDYLEDTFYPNVLASYSSLLSEQIYCNDRSLAPDNTGTGYGTSRTYYGSRNRLYTNKAPILTCPNLARDGFTLTTSSVGNKKLTKSIGLITADEIALAGGKYNTNNNSYYLYIGNYFWAGSPYSYSVDHANESSMYGGGAINGGNVNGNSGVRPVVSLLPSVKISSGDGTKALPYEIMNGNS